MVLLFCNGILLGQSYNFSDLMLIKFDHTSNYFKTYSSSLHVAANGDKYFAIVSDTNLAYKNISFEKEHLSSLFIFKFNSNNNLIWSKRIASALSQESFLQLNTFRVLNDDSLLIHWSYNNSVLFENDSIYIPKPTEKDEKKDIFQIRDINNGDLIEFSTLQSDCEVDYNFINDDSESPALNNTLLYKVDFHDPCLLTYKDDTNTFNNDQYSAIELSENSIKELFNFKSVWNLRMTFKNGFYYISGDRTWTSASVNGDYFNFILPSDLRIANLNFVSKVDSNGSIIWDKCFGAKEPPNGGGGKGSLWKRNELDLVDHVVSPDGKVIVAGSAWAMNMPGIILYENSDPTTYTSSSSAGNNALLIGYDDEGMMIWKKFLPCSNSRIRDLEISPTGDILVLATTSGKCNFTSSSSTTNNIYSTYLICYDQFGHEKWFRQIGGGIGVEMSLDELGNIHIIGRSYSEQLTFSNSQYSFDFDDHYGIFISTLNSNEPGLGVDIRPSSESRISLYPNPSNDFINIESSEELDNLKVYNLNGKLLINKKITGKRHKFDTFLSSGMYLFEIVDKSGYIKTIKTIVN
jgi:hypothetical protein